MCFFQSKPFLLLHPTSVFFYKSDLLHLKDEKEPGKQDNPFQEVKGKLSNKHELLTYV